MARVTVVTGLDIQAIYVGNTLYKQDEDEFLESTELCDFLDILGVSVNLIQGDDRVEDFVQENGALPEKLTELQQIIGGR